MKITSFQQKVYDAVSQIPPGKVTTYKLLAKAINCGSTQAVGQALRCNPFAPKVPCHRVISTDLSIGGFSGARSGELIDKKLALLAAEGVQFQDGHLADHTAIFRFN